MIDPHQFSLEEALRGTEAPSEVIESLTIATVPYITFAGVSEMGQFVIHKELAEEIQEIFQILHEKKFPIHKIVPAVAYGWDDIASMADNNSSAFNYRRIIGTDRVSNHSFGTAVDINPLQNPYYAADGATYPSGAAYNPAEPGTLTMDGDAVKLFKERGWRWLGEREEATDYQHFDKVLPSVPFAF